MKKQKKTFKKNIYRKIWSDIPFKKNDLNNWNDFVK